MQAQHLPGGGGPPLPHIQLPLPDFHRLAADLGVDSRTTSVQLSIIFYYSVFVSSKRGPNVRGFNGTRQLPCIDSGKKRKIHGAYF